MCGKMKVSVKNVILSAEARSARLPKAKHLNTYNNSGIFSKKGKGLV